MATKPNDDSSLSHRRWNWKYHIVFIPISPKLAVSLFMGYLKGKSSLMIFDKHANLKYRFTGEVLHIVHKITIEAML